MNRLYKFIFVALLFIGAVGCEEDQSTKPQHADYQANEWIYKVMRSEYLWKGNITPFPDYNTDYLTFYRSVLMKPAANLVNTEPHDGGYDINNRFDPYSAIERRAIVGTTRASYVETGFGYGAQFTFVQSGTSGVMARVLYVIAGSPADTKLKRGDWIGEINDQRLNILNYMELANQLTNPAGGATVSLMKYTSKLEGINVIFTKGETVSLQSVAITENPVFRSEKLTVDTHNIGYLAYNRFKSGTISGDLSFDADLKAAIADFSGQIDHLVLDLRYNPGGELETSCRLLSSLVAPADKAGTLFATLKFFNSEQTLNYLSAGDQGGANLGFMGGVNSVYVLTTRMTASASEMVINSLRAVGLTVHIIGAKTAGKNVGSSSYTKEIIDNNPALSHLAGGHFGGYEYLISPIRFQIFNANNQSEYANGFAFDKNCDIDELEDQVKLYDLGDPAEPLLKKAIELITATPEARSAVPTLFNRGEKMQVLATTIRE